MWPDLEETMEATSCPEANPYPSLPPQRQYLPEAGEACT